MKTAWLLLFAGSLGAQEFAAAPQLDAAIQAAIQAKQIPGAVLLVGQGDRVLHYKAYGQRALVPAPEPMTKDTIFDAASLTKVVATTSAVMRLFEQGRVRLADPVTQYLPQYQGGKSPISVRHLLTHFSGLRPDLDLKPVWSGYDTGIQKALIDKPVAAPNQRFIYSDINFILLGEIVHRVSGVPLDEFCKREVFAPLGMKDSGYNPPAALRARIAPTEWYAGDPAPLRGVVHDETTKYMNGVAGHAGLFTTAEDLARFARMMLSRGELEGKRHFAANVIDKFTSPATPADQTVLRGLGWDIDSPYSGNRGELFPIGSYGHTGFTGTSLWIDPSTSSYVVLLTNAVHPKRGPAITRLRGQVATITAAALGLKERGRLRLTGYNEVGASRRTIARNAETKTGLDVLAAEGFRRLAGKRVGLVTNHTGIDRQGRRNIDVMLEAKVNLVALFSPEHGIAGKLDQEDIAHGKDEKTGLPVWSLYQPNQRKASAEMLAGVDVLVFDIQDIGARFYTYVCTMVNVMEDAAARKIPLIVLDRPNPITGVHVEGPMIDADQRSFVGCLDLPLRHGMTMGELARMAAAARPGAQVEVVKMENWERGDWWDSTGLPWVDPSPNMRSLNAALLYPGVAMLEYAKNYSVGRGTDAPFEQIGADWIRGPELAQALNARQIPGVRVYATRFTPNASNLQGKLCEGVRFVITDRDVFDATRLGMELGVMIEKLYPGKMEWERNLRLIGSRRVWEGMKGQQDPRALVQGGEEEMARFLGERAKYLIY
ncbi:MAG: DUF1343 domain-containing protein [Bryobacter sp.]|nr:DUF1343 domain-containing protein [Bryobacter sp.]